MLVILGPPDCLQAVHILMIDERRGEEGRGEERRGEEGRGGVVVSCENRVNESLIKFSNIPISNPHPRL